MRLEEKNPRRYMPTSNILFCDDDRLALERLSLSLRDAGFTVHAETEAATGLAAWQRFDFALAILDVMMPSHGFDWIEAKGGAETGVVLARRMKAIRPAAKVVGVSQLPKRDVHDWFTRNASGLWDKSELLNNPEVFVRRVHRVLDPGNISNLRVFIVHGHDRHAAAELKDYLQQALGIEHVAILWDLPWRGRTVIEKFEDAARDADVVFVLLTPDDLAISGQAVVRQSRPNVMLELGYFLGSLARSSGRVVMLTKGHVAMPSDLSGVGTIDIAAGIDAVGEAIRRELTWGI